jgi:hypothetical protein
LAEQEDGAGNGVAVEEAITGTPEAVSSLDGFGSAAPEGPVSEHPEILLAAAIVGGLLLAGVVSRLGR